jgi:aminomethyltransferase
VPVPSPFHERILPLCTSLFFKEWAGYHAVRSFDTSHEREYFAFRHSAGLIDVSPLFKYEVKGKDAAALLSRVTSRNIAKLAVGRVSYLCWCDDEGKVVDDGTVTRLGEHEFRMTAAEPTLAWLSRYARRSDVTIEDSSERLGALALQGPTSRVLLNDALDRSIDPLAFFGCTQRRLGGKHVWVTRTGYTGDLGYEVWCERGDALAVWDALMEAGRAHRIVPAGIDALDVARVEAGFIMNGVDYYSAHHCLVESRKSTPYELGLGWTIDLDREAFVGQAALKAAKARGPAWKTVGLVSDWDEYEALFAEVGLPPHVRSGAWRDPVPVYDAVGRQVGYATSGAWSPVLKASLALATIKADHAEVGNRLKIEATVEFQRRKVTAVVTKTPFFNPERKRAKWT